MQHAQLAAQPCAADRIDERVRVQAILDGDTLRLSDGRSVRLIAVNTPEQARDGQPAEPLAERASRALQDLLSPGSTVALRYDAERQDRHGRYLAHAFTTTGENVAAALLAQGLGFAIVVAPNVWQVDCYFAEEQRARHLRAGVWGHAAYQPRSSDSVAMATRGFVLLRGRVTRTGKSNKNLWLEMGARVALKIPRKHLHYFDDMPIEAYLGRDIIARGWVSFYNDKLRMTISHPAMLAILD